MENKKFQKVFSKNYLKMNRIVWFNTELLMPGILEIRKKFEIKEELPIIDISKEKNNFNKLFKESDQKMDAFFENIEKKLPDFYRDLGGIRKNLQLGKEWNSTLARFAICGIFLPPAFSVFIHEDKDKKIITFELNKDTTMDDLCLAWKNTEDIRKKMFGKARATFPNKKTIDNFANLTKYKEIKYRSKTSLNSTHDQEYKKSDLDIIGEIYPDENDITQEADKKRLNKLKVSESRLKKITS